MPRPAPCAVDCSSRKVLWPVIVIPLLLHAWELESSTRVALCVNVPLPAAHAHRMVLRIQISMTNVGVH
jgi:hypothetical protein